MQTIFLRKEHRDYTKLSNELLRRKGMSGLAKAILLMMLSHKDGWKTTMKQIEDSFTDGQLAIRKAIYELQSAGHAEMHRIYNHKKKRPDGVLWKWYSHPDLTKEFQVKKYRPKKRKSNGRMTIDGQDHELPRPHVSETTDRRMTISQRTLTKKEDTVMKEEVSAGANGYSSKSWDAGFSKTNHSW